MNKQMKILQQTIIAVLMSLATSTAFAEIIADVQIAGGLYLTPTVNYDTAYLRVSSNTMDVTQSFEAGEAISITNNGLDDGVYSYELTLVSIYIAEEKGAPKDESSVTQGGDFKVQNGMVVDSSNEVEEAIAQQEAEEIAQQVNSGENEGVSQ